MGSWSERHVVRERRVLLFQRAILFTKKLKDHSLQTKAVLMVSRRFRSYEFSGKIRFSCHQSTSQVAFVHKSKVTTTTTSFFAAIIQVKLR